MGKYEAENAIPPAACLIVEELNNFLIFDLHSEEL